MRCLRIARHTLIVLVSLTGLAVADDFPKDLVAWSPITANPVFQGAGGNAWDCKIRERGWILVDDGTYHLWYSGYKDDRSSTKFLGHATSPDGIHWTRDSRNPLVTTSWVEDVCVVRHDGEYFLFAEGKNDVAHLLTSSDGIHWTEQGVLDIRKTDGTPIDPGPYGTPTAWVEGGIWYLLYERSDRGVWLATSPDRRTWTNVRDTPVLPRGPEPYDQAAIAVDQIVKRDGMYYAFYHANASYPWRDWTTNLARSRDLIHWEKYPGNPIIQHNCSSGILVCGPQGSRFYTMHPDVRVFEPPNPAQR
jgi:sucrose-6-phosphate hydrolase SacC (GH32 family)